MSKPESCDIEDVRREARKIEEETGRPVEIYEHFVENSDGTRTHTAGFRTKPRAVREAAEVVLKRGGKPMRDEDGVVRLHWPELETNAGGAADSDNEETPEQRGHFEVTAWPLRSRRAGRQCHLVSSCSSSASGSCSSVGPRCFWART